MPSPAPDVSPKGEGIRGDLHVVVRVKEHEHFRREGDHLLLEMPTSFTQAALGAEVEVPTLEGTTTFTMPRATQHGAMFRVNGHGLPNLRSAKRGDLIIGVRIEIPKKLTSKQEKLLRDFAETEDEKVLPESHGFFKKIRDIISG